MKLVLIDGNAILHRAFHAIPPLTTTRGQLVNAVYGFISMILRIRDDLKPEYLVVCFDRPKPTFRQEIFVGYQAHRPKMDEGLVSQIETVHRVVRTLNVPIYEMDGFEADDLLGTISLQVKKEKVEDQSVEVYIVTGDRDILQLVDETTRVYMPTKGLSEAKTYDESAVIEKFGVSPSQIIDYKGLVGDPSDGYVGVSGVGPKTASNLLQKYKTFHNVYSHISELPKTLSEKLEEGRDSAEVSYKLATIKRDVPIEFNFEEAKIKDFKTDAIKEMLEDLEFKSLWNRIVGKNEHEKKASKEKKDDNQLGLF